MNQYNSANGINGTRFAEPRTESQADDALGEELTKGYRPNLPVFSLWSRSSTGLGGNVFSMLNDVEQMLSHAAVEMPYQYYKAGISSVVFSVEAQSAKAGEFAHRSLSHFWEHSLETALNVYDYGWLGCEIMYRTERGFRYYDGIHDLHPFDVGVLTGKGRYVGFQLNSLGVSGTNGGHLLLWGPQKWPAKGLWLTHRRRYNRYYGRSQLNAAWRDWRRLAYPDGVEEVIDGAFYRHAYQGPELRFPVKSFRNKDGSIDYESARKRSREYMENAKAGAGRCYPNTRDEKGEFEWQEIWPEHVLDVSALTNHAEYFEKKISKGIGVPPELLEAADTGSGYSGRKIPLQGFYTTQLSNARNIVRAFQRQVIDPLLRWNFGPGHKVDIKVKLVTPEASEGQPGQGAPQQGAPGQPGQAASAAPAAPNPLAQLVGGQPMPDLAGSRKGGHIPYQGKRGGKGWKDPKTGHIHYE